MPRRTYWLYPSLDSVNERRRRRQLRERYGRNRAAQAQIENSYVVKSINQANLISSNVPGKPGVHAPVIDMDLECKLVPSSTKGHYHLYIEKEIPEDKYYALLDALVDAGIVEEGYVAASKEKGGTFVRPPGVRKTKVWREEYARVREAEEVPA